MSIAKQANKLSWARLIYADGAAAVGDFPLSNEDLLIPGKSIEIKAGAADDPTTLFKGVIVKHSLKLRGHTQPQLIVECRHKAAKLTVGRKNAYFAEQTDSDVITALLDGAGLSAEVDSTSVTHEQLVQYASSDWDFLLARAHANGLLVLCGDEENVSVVAPSPSGEPEIELVFGATLLELDVEMDAREQYGAVKGRSWDPAAQEVVEVEAADPGIADPGNLSSSDLAGTLGVDHFPLQHVGLPEPEAQAWADATWMYSQLGRVRGLAKCEGIGGVDPGMLAKLTGVGERFAGPVYLTGVRHEFDLVRGWKTYLQFGTVEAPKTGHGDMSAPKAGALVPGVSGLQIGVVASNEGDPASEHRVQVRMPMVSSDDDGSWARVATLDAGDDRGTFFRPEVGDEVLLGFLDDDPRNPVILGMLHSSAKPAPWEGSDDNHEKGYRSRSKLELHFNDDTKVLTLSTPNGNSIVLSEEDGGITITDENGNVIALSSDGIRIESCAKLELVSADAATIESGADLELTAGAAGKFEGSAGVEVSSSAETVIKGSLVRIN